MQTGIQVSWKKLGTQRWEVVGNAIQVLKDHNMEHLEREFLIAATSGDENDLIAVLEQWFHMQQ